MSRLWSLFKPTPPTPLEERVVPSASAPVVDASAIDAIFAGIPQPTETIDALVAEAVPPPPPPEPPLDLSGEFQGQVVALRQGPAHAIELHSTSPADANEATTIAGTLLYDDPTQPQTAPRAAGIIELTRSGRTHRLRLESLEDRARASLMFPRDFRVSLEDPGSQAPDHAWHGAATLTLRTQNRRGKVPACQTFQLTIRPITD